MRLYLLGAPVQPTTMTVSQLWPGLLRVRAQNWKPPQPPSSPKLQHKEAPRKGLPSCLEPGPILQR